MRGSPAVRARTVTSISDYSIQRRFTPSVTSRQQTHKDVEHVNESRRGVQGLPARKESNTRAHSKAFHFYWHEQVPAAWTSSQLKPCSLLLSPSRFSLIGSSSLTHVPLFCAITDSSLSCLNFLFFFQSVKSRWPVFTMVSGSIRRYRSPTFCGHKNK